MLIFCNKTTFIHYLGMDKQGDLAYITETSEDGDVVCSESYPTMYPTLQRRTKYVYYKDTIVASNVAWNQEKYF